MLSVAGLILAAGSGRRLGAPKALLTCDDGSLLVERAVGAAHQGGCDPIVVVLGAGAEQVRARADLGGAVVIVNQAWGTGVGSSLRAGLQTVTDTEAVAAIVMPVDMPGITAEAVARVAQLPHREALVCGTYQGRRSHPVLIGRAHWAGVCTLANADVSLRPYLLARAGQVTEVACDEVASGEDVDTTEDAARAGVQLAAPITPGPTRRS